MTSVLITRIALFLLMQCICCMRGYSRATRLFQIDRLTDSHVKRLPLSERKRRSSIESFVFNSSSNLSFELDQENDSPLNNEQTDRKTDECKLTEARHQRKILRSKGSGSVIHSKSEQAVYPKESLALLHVLRYTSASRQQSEHEVSQTITRVINISKWLRSAQPSDSTTTTPTRLTNRVSESVTNSLVIKTIINKLIANLYELHGALTTMLLGIAVDQDRTGLFLDTALASASREIAAKIILRTDAKELQKLRRHLSKISVESLKELINSQLLASQALTDQLNFQDFPKEIATNKSAIVSHNISSSTLRSIVRKKRSPRFQRDKSLSDTAINEIAVKTLADLIAKVLRIYNSSLSVSHPRMSDQTELNDTDVLSEVMSLKNDSKNIVARKTLKAARVATETIYQLMERLLILKTKPETTPDITIPFDEKRILSSVSTDLRRVLQWTLNLSDIILKNLTGGETKSSESNIQTTAGKTEKTINAIRSNVTTQVFVDLLPKVTKAFKTVIEHHEVNETYVSSVTLDNPHRSAWKEKRKYDASSSRHKRLVAPHPRKDSFYKRRSKDIHQQLPKVSIPECVQQAVVAPEEYGVYRIEKGLMISKLDPRDLENPLEFPIEGLENIPRYRNIDVALEFSFRHPLLVSGIGFKRLPNGRRDIVQLASIYVEKQKDRNSWSPLLDEETHDIMLLKVTSKTLHSFSPLHDAWSGIRLYPQKWSSSKPYIGRPIFIYCAFNP